MYLNNAWLYSSNCSINNRFESKVRTLDASAQYAIADGYTLIQHSGLICVDFDHVEDVPALKQQLLEHEYFDTILMFTSPSGNGVKWIVEVDLQGWEHSRFFKSMANCLKATGLPPVDISGSDVARACFLSYDPDVYIHPQFQDYAKETLYTPAVGRLLR